MRISIAMASYNGSRYLQAQLDSIAAQTLLPSELVVSDDGSSDDTLAIVSAFGDTAPFPVRILPHDRRRGFADNFLHAALACQHELIAFCDQDDVWLPNKLAVARQRIEADDSLLAIHRLTTTDDNLTAVGLWTQGIEADAVFEPLALDPYVNGWGNTMLFRRELLAAIPHGRRPRQPEKPERPLSHDTWIYVLAAALGRVSHIAEPLALYRQHDTNAIGVNQPSTPRKPMTGSRLSMDKLRERMVFYGEMAILFDEASRTDDHPFTAAATAAAERYMVRHAPLAERLAIYDSPTLASRLRAFTAMNRSRPVQMTSRAKDLVLGVAGLHGLLGSSKPASARSRS